MPETESNLSQWRRRRETCALPPLVSVAVHVPNLGEKGCMQSALRDVLISTLRSIGRFSRLIMIDLHTKKAIYKTRKRLRNVRICITGDPQFWIWRKSAVVVDLFTAARLANFRELCAQLMVRTVF